MTILSSNVFCNAEIILNFSLGKLVTEKKTRQELNTVTVYARSSFVFWKNFTNIYEIVRNITTFCNLTTEAFSFHNWRQN